MFPVEGGWGLAGRIFLLYVACGGVLAGAALSVKGHEESHCPQVGVGVRWGRGAGNAKLLRVRTIYRG